MATCMRDLIPIIDRDLIPIIDMVRDSAQAVGLQSGDVNMNVSVHKDNSGALDNQIIMSNERIF
jgi:hypothetical protein